MNLELRLSALAEACEVAPETRGMSRRRRAGISPTR